MNLRVIKSFYFEAARRIPGSDNEITGCSYRVDVIAAGSPHPVYGWIVDFGDMKAALDPLVRHLDHSLLDDVPGLENTAPERIRAWLLDRIQPRPAWLEDIRVLALTVDCFRLIDLPASADEHLPDRVAFHFAAAQALDVLPAGHPCRNLHGHTYRVEAGVEQLRQPETRAKLESLLADVFGQLNNAHLNRVPGLQPPTCERMADWLWRRLENAGLRPNLVAIQETHKNRCECRGD